MAMNDDKGCSLCTTPGSERYETFTTKVGCKVKNYVLYDYRHTDGVLFSTIAPTLAMCRQKRDQWLESKESNKQAEQ